MGFEISIASIPASPVPSKKRRRHQGMHARSRGKTDPSSSTSIAAAPANEQACAEEPAVGMPSSLHESESTQDAGHPTRKRPRYTSSAAASLGFVSQKLDPAKAAPLPKTLPLDSKRPSGVFSARSFSELSLDQYLLKQLEKMGLGMLTPVQQHAIPRVLDGRNMLIRSPTGSGKTLAYAVPGVHALLQMEHQRNLTRSAGTHAMVLVPTRELCLQTHEVVEKLCQPFPHLVCGMLMGGERRKAEKARLRKGVTIVVGTPGRVLDHMKSTCSWVFCDCRLLVLDEADRLLDLGFQSDIEAIIAALDARTRAGVSRQTLLLSATLTSKLRVLAGKSLDNFETLHLSSDGLEQHAQGHDGSQTPGEEPVDSRVLTDSLEAPLQLKQSYAVVPSKQRLTSLVSFLRSRCFNSDECKILVFLSSCDGVDFHFSVLTKVSWPDLQAAKVAAGHAAPDPSAAHSRGTDDGHGFGAHGDDTCVKDERVDADGRLVGMMAHSPLIGANVHRLHGKLGQAQRTQIFQSFRSMKSGVLLCTDVAARGLNLQGVHWILQYDLPQDPKEYVHRVGRAARLGQRGRAVLFLNPSEEPFLQLLRDLGMELLELKFASLQAALAPASRSRHDIYVMEMALQRQMEQAVVELPFLHAAASEAYQSYLRSYATHSKAVQRVLHIGQLHLGHIAKSFALKDIPSQISRQQGKRRQQKPSRKGYAPTQGSALNHGPSKVTKVASEFKQKHGQRLARAKSTVSEFSAGDAFVPL